MTLTAAQPEKPIMLCRVRCGGSAARGTRVLAEGLPSACRQLRRGQRVDPEAGFLGLAGRSGHLHQCSRTQQRTSAPSGTARLVGRKTDDVAATLRSIVRDS